MKDVQDNKVVSRLTKLNPVTTDDLSELDSLVFEHEVNFWNKSDTLLSWLSEYYCPCDLYNQEKLAPKLSYTSHSVV